MLRSHLRPLLAVLVFAAVGVATACGGGGGSGGSSSGKLSVSVTGMTPSSGATDIAVSTSEIRVQVNRDLDASTLSTASVFVEETKSGVTASVQGLVGYASGTREIVWTLNENRNTQLSGQNRLEFNAVYTIRVTGAVRSLLGEPVNPAFSGSFQTAATQFSFVASGSDPQPGATGTLVDPLQRLVNGSLVFCTLQVKVDIALSRTSVQTAGNVQLREGGAAGVSVPGVADLDTATNTICWIPSPGHSNAFPLEPLLKTNTAYAFVLTTGLQAANGSQPTQEVSLPFTTVAANFVAPTASNLVLNEVLAGPLTSEPASDSNGDAVVSTGADEFIEWLNTSSDYVFLQGFELKDPTVNKLVTFNDTSFPNGQKFKAMIAPGAVLLVFGGGGTPSNDRFAIGHGRCLVGTGTINNGYWNNDGDTALFVNSTSGVPAITVGYGSQSTPPVSMTTGFGGVSLCRVPDGTGALSSNHLTATGNRFSPGKKTDGTIFK